MWENYEDCGKAAWRMPVVSWTGGKAALTVRSLVVSCRLPVSLAAKSRIANGAIAR